MRTMQVRGHQPCGVDALKVSLHAKLATTNISVSLILFSYHFFQSCGILLIREEPKWPKCINSVSARALAAGSTIQSSTIQSSV